MALTPEQVEHVAALARLGITPAERQRFAVQLSTILDHFQALQALDTEQIPPTAQVLDLRNVMRPDAVQPSLPQAEVLANAPRSCAGRVLPRPGRPGRVASARPAGPSPRTAWWDRDARCLT